MGTETGMVTEMWTWLVDESQVGFPKKNRLWNPCSRHGVPPLTMLYSSPVSQVWPSDST